MKKIIAVLSAIVMSVSVFAQSIPNCGFEEWSSSGLFTQEQPNDWTAALVGNVTQEIFGITVPIPVNTYFGTKTTDAHSGNYAMKLQANSVGIVGTDYSFLCPGIAQLGHAEGFEIPLSTITNIASIIGNQDTSGLGNIDWNSLATLQQLLSPGVPCSQTPAKVTMWVKYLPQEGDSMMVIAFSKLNGSFVSYAFSSFGATMSDYTQLTVEFDSPLANCDSVGVIIVSGGFGTSEATTLIVDDIAFDFNIAVDDYDMARVAVYPNPATSQLTIAPEEGAQYDFQLVDLSGRVVIAKNGVVGNAVLNTGSLSSGVYMLKVKQNERSAIQKVVIQ